VAQDVGDLVGREHEVDWHHDRATARQRLEMMQGALRLSPDRLRGVGQATLMGRF
jgi:hypothetical protein